MATRTSVGSGPWNTAGTWDTGVPLDGDDVVISAGHTVTFDADQSAFTTGVKLTITGTLTHTTASGNYCLFIKTGASVVGAGTWNIGTSGAGAIPFASKHIITGAAGWYVDGVLGLTVNVYGAEPTYTYIRLSGNEAIGQTELSVNTDVTGDIWADGDIIRIGNEERTIAAGGRAAAAITVTAGLTAAKTTNELVILCSRNIKIVCNSAANYTFYRVVTMNIGSGYFAGATKIILHTITALNISGGVFTYSAPMIQSSNLTMSGGIITGSSAQYGFRYVLFVSVTGGIAHACGASDAVVKECSGLLGSMWIYRCGTAIGPAYSASSVDVLHLVGTIIEECTNAIAASNIWLTNCTIKTCIQGLAQGSGNIRIDGGTWLNNTYHIRSSWGVGYNLTLTGGTENHRYDNADQSQIFETFEIINYGGVAGAYKSWPRGGVITSQATTKPDGFERAYTFALANAVLPCWRKLHFVVEAGKSVSVQVQARKTASMAYLPRVYLMNSIQSPVSGGTPVDTFTMTNSTDTWESDTFSIDNSLGTDDKEYTLWFIAKNATGSAYFAYKIVAASSGGGLLTNPGMAGGMRG